MDISTVFTINRLQIIKLRECTNCILYLASNSTIQVLETKFLYWFCKRGWNWSHDGVKYMYQLKYKLNDETETCLHVVNWQN